MTLAEELLNGLEESYLVNPTLEPHIVIDMKRNIHVPKDLQRIAVQRDHNIETVTFDCPRYWDGHDLSQMYIFVYYQRPDRVKAPYLCQNVTIDEENTNIMHFTWTLDEHATLAKGKMQFLVCAKETTDTEVPDHKWYTEINREMHISEGMDCEDVVYDVAPAIITDLLTRMDNILLANDPLVLDKSLTQPNLAAEAKSVGEALAALETAMELRITDFEDETDIKFGYLMTYVTPQMYGAKADGVTDDTAAIKAALATFNNVYLPEGTYLVSEPLYVKVNTQTLTGASSRAFIQASSTFPEGEPILTFYSTNTDYILREHRENRHGGFTVKGYNRICHGIRIGGAVGTEYEGAVEASIFSNILVADCDVAYLWGAHVYRDTLFQCDCRDDNFSLKTTGDITDSGEVFTCINCGFWGACKIHLTCGCYFYGCTIHILGTQTVSGVGDMTHYLNNGYFAFQNCHFEGILRTSTDREMERPPFLVAHDANVTLSDCDGIISGDFVTYSDCAIKAIATTGNGIPTAVNINGGYYKYMFGRMKFADSSGTLTKGNVNINGVDYRYIFDSMTIDNNIYDDSKHLTLNRDGTFDVIIGVHDIDGLNLSQSKASNKTSFTFTMPAWQATGVIGFYRKVAAGNHKALRVNGTVTSAHDDFTHSMTSGTSEATMFMFLDKYGNVLSPVAENIEYNTYDHDLTVNAVVGFPHGTTDILIGFDVRRGGGFGTGTYTVDCSLIYEFI